MIANSQPTLLALLMCDAVIREEGTGKTSLMGIFDTIGARSFPCVHHRMYVYVALTDGEGSPSCELRILDEAGTVMARVGGPLQFRERTSLVEVNLCVNGITFPDQGTYAVAFYADNRLVGQRRLVVRRAGGGGAHA